MSVIRWLGLAGLMRLAFALPGCSKDKAADGNKRYVIATVVKVDGIAWFETMREGGEAFGKDTGHQVLVLGPAKADAAEQVQIIEGLIAQQVDAICVVPFSVEAVEPVLKKARERGIVVISHVASSQQNADLIIEPFQNAEYGRHLMDELARSMGQQGESATFVASLTSKSHNEWVDAARNPVRVNPFPAPNPKGDTRSEWATGSLSSAPRRGRSRSRMSCTTSGKMLRRPTTSLLPMPNALHRCRRYFP